jgi:uncharacterized protein YecT (DUF1311 family)
MAANSCRCLFVAIVLLLAAGATCRAEDDFNRAESLKAPGTLCIADTPMRSAICDAPAFAEAIKAVEAAAKQAFVRARPRTAPLIKRDQVWFRDIIESITEDGSLDDIDAKIKMNAILRRRAAALEDIASGFGRRGIAGRWTNVFGVVDVVPTGRGLLRVILSTNVQYRSDDEQRQSCRATVLVRPAPDGWFSGTVNTPSTDTKRAPRPTTLKLRLQGETLRVLAGDEIKDQAADIGFNCSHANQLTASYFPADASGAASAGRETAPPFVAPTFDCSHPATASEEEICADPELAANDVRLNQLWHKLLPRLDSETRRLLTEDQRGWLTARAERYPSMLHPAWAKQSYFVHWTALGRDNLADLQRERISMLERFDETRRGLEGEWQGYNARLSVWRDKDGELRVEGDKWFEADYKGGCDYEFKGSANGNAFIPADTGKNPDTIERDHGSLIVNRADDDWVRRRERPDGTLDREAGEGKCKRGQLISSTARLFPVRPAPDPGK